MGLWARSRCRCSLQLLLCSTTGYYQYGDAVRLSTEAVSSVQRAGCLLLCVEAYGELPVDDSVVGRLSHCVQAPVACPWSCLAHARFGEATAPAARPRRHGHGVTALANLPGPCSPPHSHSLPRAVKSGVEAGALHSSATQQTAVRVHRLQPVANDVCSQRGFAASVLAEGGRHSNSLG